MARNKKIIILSAIILLIGIPAITYYFLFSGPGKEFELERYVVPLGADATQDSQEAIIYDLKEKGFIRNEWAFNLILKKKGWMQPGAYKVSKTWDVWSIAETLVRFRYQGWVVIPEGLRNEEVAEILQEKLYWKDDTKEEFLNYDEEGYLFPDTYLLDFSQSGEAGKAVAERMKNQFNEKVAELFKEAAEKNIRNDTLIVLASLVQREAANEEEMPLIAGVIWNRWLEDMPFQIDATIQYELGGPGNWWPVIKPDDYKIDSPYNTYIYKGRPPTPICNPGLAAIDAVINSEDSEYLYYLHDSEGQIHLAETYEEHLENIEEYLK